MQPFKQKHSLAIRKQPYITDYFVKTIGKIILVLLFFLAGILSSMAQDFTITGNVSDVGGIPVDELSVIATAEGVGVFLNEEVFTEENGDYEIEFPVAAISGAEVIYVTIIDCDGNPISNIVNVTFLGYVSDVDFIFCDEGNGGGPSGGVCNAGFIVIPNSSDSPFFPSDTDGYILAANYFNEDEEVIYTWTIDGEIFVMNDVPFFPFDFEEEDEYEICLTISSESCTVNDCQTIDITFEANGGCLDPEAINYDPSADFDDGSCVFDCSAAFEIFPDYFGSNEFFFNILYLDFESENTWQISAPGFEDTFESNSPFTQYEFPSSGVYQVCLAVTSVDCTDTYCENISVVIDGSSIEGCTDPEAVNYNPFAIIDNGSCYYADEVFCGPGEQMVQLEIITDEFPEDISWSIINIITGEVYISNGTLGPIGVGFTYLPHQTYVHEICVPSDETLLFTINDAANDGLCCSYGLGGFELSTCGAVIFEGSNFGSSFVGSIENCEGTELISGCTDSSAINFSPNANWNDGSCTYATGSNDCQPEFFVLPIGVSEEVLTVFVGDMNPESSNEWTWEIDGQNSNDTYDYFVLDGYGTYELCLTTSNGSCEDTFCQEISFSSSDTGLLEFSYINLGDLDFNFSFQPAALVMDDVMRFKWTIDNNHVFYGNDVNFSFQNTGMYDVCLELISEKSGIIFEHCKSIPVFGLGIEENTMTQISLFPNPTNHSFQLNNAQNVDSYQIININGQTLLKAPYVGQQIDVSMLPKGIYIVELTNNNAKKEFIRFSKQ